MHPGLLGLKSMTMMRLEIWVQPPCSFLLTGKSMSQEVDSSVWAGTTSTSHIGDQTQEHSLCRMSECGIQRRKPSWPLALFKGLVMRPRSFPMEPHSMEGDA